MLTRRAFTILELSAVLAVIAILAALSVPVYDVMVRRARANEAQAVTYAIAHAELRHFRDHGAFLACDPGGQVPAGAGRFPSEAACWRTLGVQLAGPSYFRYAVRLDDASFAVTAEGDLDSDGRTSRYRLEGCDLTLTAEDELE